MIGAGVLVAASAYIVVETSGGESYKNAAERENESIPTDAENYPMHENIITTVFWVGEAGDVTTNDNIHNKSSVWVEDWDKAFGGIDDPNDRCGYKPCGFEPKENPFYFALPFNDYDENGLKPISELNVIPWFDGQLKDGESVIKNRWIKITYQGKVVYAQWEDAGPFGEDDADYVFGDDRPSEPRAGLDVSPAVADFLRLDGRGNTSWQFIEEIDVPDGPWREIITTSGPKWE